MFSNKVTQLIFLASLYFSAKVEGLPTTTTTTTKSSKSVIPNCLQVSEMRSSLLQLFDSDETLQPAALRLGEYSGRHFIADMAKVRPAGRMQPSRLFFAALEL
jgi:hypothetical protein